MNEQIPNEKDKKKTDWSFVDKIAEEQRQKEGKGRTLEGLEKELENDPDIPPELLADLRSDTSAVQDKSEELLQEIERLKEIAKTRSLSTEEKEKLRQLWGRSE